MPSSTMRLRDARSALRKIGEQINVKPHQSDREKRRRRQQMTDGKLHGAIPETVQPVDPGPADEFIFP